LRLGPQDVHQFRFQSRSKEVLEPLVKAVCSHYQESSEDHPHQDSLLFLNFFWVLQTLSMAIWHYNVINQNVGVYPISLLSDLCNVDYAVQIAVLTTKYKHVQHKYTK